MGLEAALLAAVDVLTSLTPSSLLQLCTSALATYTTRVAVAVTGVRSSLQRACSSCTDEEGRVQRATSDAPEPCQSILSSHWYQRFHGAQSSGGEPLQHGIRQILEPRFGASFSTVRVHRDQTADTLSCEVSARAFTVGRHVFFKRGGFAPGTESGRRLIAHELAHVIQQRAAVKLQRQAEPPATRV